MNPSAPNLLREQCVAILRGLDPSLNPHDLKTLSQRAQSIFEEIEFTGSPEEVQFLEAISMLLPPEVQMLRSEALAGLRAKNAQMLKDRGLTLQSDATPEIEREIDQAALKSIQEADALRQRECTTCHEKNKPVHALNGGFKSLLQRCSRCKSELDLYCSPECQKAHWATHKVTCISTATKK